MSSFHNRYGYSIYDYKITNKYMLLYLYECLKKETSLCIRDRMINLYINSTINITKTEGEKLIEQIPLLYELSTNPFSTDPIVYVSGLTFKNTTFTDEGFECLVNFLKGDHIIRFLEFSGDVSFNSLRGDRFGDLCSALSSNNSLNRLLINNVSFKVGNKCSQLADVIKTNSSISTLELINNDISKDCIGFEKLFDALKNSGSIVHLSLKRNHIGSCIYSFNSILKKNSSIIDLNLTGNNILIDSVKSLASVLKKNSSLISLNISGNPCCKLADYRFECLKVFRDLLLKNTTLTDIYFGAFYGPKIYYRSDGYFDDHRCGKTGTYTFRKDGTIHLSYCSDDYSDYWY